MITKIMIHGGCTDLQRATPLINNWVMTIDALEDGQLCTYCGMPNCMYEVYGNRVSEIDIEIVNQARSDLSYLALPNGLNQDNFNSNVRIALQQTKVISLMLADLKLNHRINVSTCRAIVAKAFNEDSPADIDEIWKRYRLWLLVFFDGFTR